MAKREYRLRLHFDEALQIVDAAVMSGSVSASYEDGSDWQSGDIYCAVRIYERYSYFGKNRVSMSVTLFGRDGDVNVSAVTSGGSQAMFFKINTWGEESFLDTLDRVLSEYQ